MLCLLQLVDQVHNNDGGASSASSSGGGLSIWLGLAIGAMAIVVAVLSTLATFMGVRAWRKRHNLDVFGDDDDDDATSSMMSHDSSSSSSKLSSIMFRAATVRTDCPADTMSNPTVNSRQTTSLENGQDNPGYLV